MCGYVASKHAVLGLTRTALEWGSRGVRVNAILPGYVESRMLEEEYLASGRTPFDAAIS
jgi:NAD(P)-dependent dehydrogenase (short-subunit alcohol dehydrogenase family)